MVKSKRYTFKLVDFEFWGSRIEPRRGGAFSAEIDAAEVPEQWLGKKYRKY